MHILSIRPAPPGQGNTRARFDVELDSGLRLYHLKLAETPSGWRVFAPSAFGDATATFPRDLAADLASAARLALGRHTPMTASAQPETKVGEDRRYWTHKVKPFPEPVAQFRMAQLIDFDDRLYETARVVYRFLVGWYYHEHGDALMSQRHVAKVMKQRAPDGAVVPSRNAVQRAIIVLMDTGWVVRTAKGRGRNKTASRYVPVVNVLELAEQGRFPGLARANGPDQDENEVARANGPVFPEVAHATGPVDAELAHVTGPKTRLPDPRTKDSGTGSVSIVSAPAPAPGLPAAQGGDGFERIWRAYDKLGSKAAAREAFEAIVDPDIDHIAARAASWAASAKPGQKRMPLEKWLSLEKYDEADRVVPGKAEPKPKAKLQAANDNTAVDDDEDEHPKPWDVGIFSPFGKFTGTIVTTEVTTEKLSEHISQIQLVVGFDTTGLGAPDIHHTIHCQNSDEETQQRGARFLEQLCGYTGVRSFEKPEVLHGTEVTFTISNRGQITYHSGRRTLPVDSSEAA